ncbi:hypothetical protein MKW98_032100 [Papaver atlanticum]|uniref:Uncharacterized protein n=1 Tax=Papaver atlanticum TaxID=357466 RepID=A0AAD4SH45_9MAGN|nr:hypothetical protein MKW98_032100 [Papaver atlanticum]
MRRRCCDGIVDGFVVMTRNQDEKMTSMMEENKLKIWFELNQQVEQQYEMGTEVNFNGIRHLILKETEDVKDLNPLSDGVLIKVEEAEKGLLVDYLTETTKEKPFYSEKVLETYCFGRGPDEGVEVSPRQLESPQMQILDLITNIEAAGVVVVQITRGITGYHFVTGCRNTQLLLIPLQNYSKDKPMVKEVFRDCYFSDLGFLQTTTDMKHDYAQLQTTIPN